LETEPEAAPKRGKAGLDWGVDVITFCTDAAREGGEADDTDDDDGPHKEEEGERESASQDLHVLEQQGANQVGEWAAASEHTPQALSKEEKEEEECLKTIKIDAAGSEIPESRASWRGCSRASSPIAVCTSTSGLSSTSLSSLEEDVDMKGRFAALFQMEEARKSKKYYWEEEDYVSEEEQGGQDHIKKHDVSHSEEFGLTGPEILRMFGLEVPEIEQEKCSVTVEASAVPVSFRRTTSNGGGGRAEKPTPPAPHLPSPHTFLRRTASGGPGDTCIHTVTGTQLQVHSYRHTVTVHYVRRAGDGFCDFFSKKGKIDRLSKSEEVSQLQRG